MVCPPAAHLSRSIRSPVGLHRITDPGGAASHDAIPQHFAEHPSLPIPPSRTGGTLTSIKAVQRRLGPQGAGPLLQRDERARRYRIGNALLTGPARAFAMADARPSTRPGARRGIVTGHLTRPRHRQKTAAPIQDLPLATRTVQIGGTDEVGGDSPAERVVRESRSIPAISGT
ncbi:hypothetical protein GCM10009837_87290 [Streptomyces durmitorensis]